MGQMCWCNCIFIVTFRNLIHLRRQYGLWTLTTRAWRKFWRGWKMWEKAAPWWVSLTVLLHCVTEGIVLIWIYFVIICCRLIINCDGEPLKKPLVIGGTALDVHTRVLWWCEWSRQDRDDLVMQQSKSAENDWGDHFTARLCWNRAGLQQLGFHNVL